MIEKKKTPSSKGQQHHDPWKKELRVRSRDQKFQGWGRAKGLELLSHTPKGRDQTSADYENKRVQVMKIIEGC